MYLLHWKLKYLNLLRYFLKFWLPTYIHVCLFHLFLTWRNSFLNVSDIMCMTLLAYVIGSLFDAMLCDGKFCLMQRVVSQLSQHRQKKIWFYIYVFKIIIIFLNYKVYYFCVKKPRYLIEWWFSIRLTTLF